MDRTVFFIRKMWYNQIYNLFTHFTTSTDKFVINKKMSVTHLEASILCNSRSPQNMFIT